WMPDRRSFLCGADLRAHPRSQKTLANVTELRTLLLASMGSEFPHSGQVPRDALPTASGAGNTTSRPYIVRQQGGLRMGSLRRFVALAFLGLLFALPAHALPVYSTPSLSVVKSSRASVTLQVTAGATGAPSGFTVEWMLKSDYDAYG